MSLDNTKLYDEQTLSVYSNDASRYPLGSILSDPLMSPAARNKIIELFNYHFDRIANNAHAFRAPLAWAGKETPAAMRLMYETSSIMTFPFLFTLSKVNNEKVCDALANLTEFMRLAEDKTLNDRDFSLRSADYLKNVLKFLEKVTINDIHRIIVMPIAWHFKPVGSLIHMVKNILNGLADKPMDGRVEKTMLNDLGGQNQFDPTNFHPSVVRLYLQSEMRPDSPVVKRMKEAVKHERELHPEAHVMPISISLINNKPGSLDNVLIDEDYLLTYQKQAFDPSLIASLMMADIGI